VIDDAPNALPAGSVKSQLAQLLGFLNTHVSSPTGAHSAAAIAATPHNNVAGTNVQAQLQEIVTGLIATGASAPGVCLVGVDAESGHWLLAAITPRRSEGSPRAAQ
jgi:hypothetical protein